MITCMYSIRFKASIACMIVCLGCWHALGQAIRDDEKALLSRVEELGGKVKSSTSSDGQRVVSVDFYGCDPNDDDIRRIGHISNLKEIDVSCTKVTGRGLAWLLAGSSVEALWAHSLDLSDADLGFLSGAAQLRRLGLALNYRLTGSGFEGLRCPTLVQLDLCDCPVGERGLRHLAATFPQLKSLYVQTELSEQACRDIATIQTIDKLVVDFALSDDAQLAALSPLRNLRTLIVTDSKITDAGLLAICDLPQLTVLDMEGTQARGHVLERVAHVEELDLGGSLIDEETVRHVASMPRLRELSIGRSPIKGTDLTHLSQCSTLRSLRLWGIDVGVSCLSRLSTLTDLTLWTCDLGNFDPLRRTVVYT